MSNLKETISYKGLEDITNGNPNSMIKLLQVMMKSLNSIPKDIHEAALNYNLYDAGTLAHKFKSSIAYLKITEVDSLLNKIEDVRKNKVSQEI